MSLIRSANKKKGAALLIVIFFFITISLAIIQSATTGAIVELRTYRTLASSKFAYVAAEAGVEDIFYRTVTGKNVPASETIVLNGATSTVGITNVSATQVDVYATGNSTNSEVRQLYLSISKNKNASFPYALQAEIGGITMYNGSQVAAGDVYSDGQVIGDTGTSISGNVISASSLAADQIASSTSCVSDEVVGKTNPNIDYAQSFQMSGTSSEPLAKVSLYIKRTGNATGARIRITANNGGKPSTTDLANEVLSYSSVSTNYGYVDITFASPATLNPGTTYWIVFDSTQSSSKYWYWCRSNASTYATGSPAYKQDWSTSGAWTAVTGDMAFKTTFGGGVSKIDSVSVAGIAKADTITNSSITGNAYYQTISGSTVSGTSYPGSLTPPYVPLPISSTTIAQWKADATAGGIITGDCGSGGQPGCNTFPLTLGPKQITGNLVVDGTITVSGTLYVKGSVSFANGKTLKCAFAYLGSSCIVIADNYIDYGNGGILAGSGTSGSYILLLSTQKGCLGDNSNGNCIGNNYAVNIGNNTTKAIFYTTDSAINISSNIIATAIAGYMIQLQSGARVQYDPAIANITFSPSAASSSGAWNSNRWNEF